MEKVPLGAATVLDVGCGTGNNGEYLKTQAPSRKVYGVTLSPAEAGVADRVLDGVFVADVECWCPPDQLRSFDCILLSHVLEHLAEPGRLLKRALPWLGPEGRIVLAVPNVLHLTQRIAFLLGRFRYTDVGLMDSTHLRFFDRFSIEEIVRNSGYRIEYSGASGYVPLGRVRWKLPKFAAWVDGLGALWSTLFGWQFIIVARPTRSAAEAPATADCRGDLITEVEGTSCV
jgi:SAM-dependent methyltransferase